MTGFDADDFPASAAPVTGIETSDAGSLRER